MIVFYYIEKAYRAVKNFLFKKKKETIHLLMNLTTFTRG
jgi:hypothetical protein